MLVTAQRQMLKKNPKSLLGGISSSGLRSTVIYHALPIIAPTIVIAKGVLIFMMLAAGDSNVA